MNYDKLISQIFFIDDWHFNLSIINKYKRNVKYHNSWPKLQNYLKNRYNDSNSLKETLYRIRHNIEIKPVCKSCGNEVKFIGKGNLLFASYCCNSCAARSNETIKKKKMTQLKNWGTENCYDSDKWKENSMRTYGSIYYFASDEFKEKRKNALLKHFGTENFNKLDNIQEQKRITCLKNLGVDNPMKNHDILEKRLENMKNNHSYFKAAQKRYETMIIHNIFSKAAKKRHETMLKNNLYEKANEKRLLTMIKNHSYGKSKPEDKAYELLREKFGNEVIRQYKSELYPFACDFYIPSLDLYIEFQGSQFHQGHPYNEKDENDQIKLKELKRKANDSYRHKIGKKSQYDIMIHVWTISDVKKRNIAKTNNLNWIEFWNLNEVKEFVKSKNT